MSKAVVTAPVEIFDVMDALSDCIESTPLPKRAALQKAIEGYRDTYPEEFFWAVGMQAPAMLTFLLSTIDHAATCLCEKHLQEAVPSPTKKRKGGPPRAH